MNPAPPDGALVHIAGLTKTFRSGEQDLVVFSNIDLAIYRGERVAVIGESSTGRAPSFSASE